MPNINSQGVQHCPDCGQQLQTLWDYPNNEVWCLRCGNRFYRTLSLVDGRDSETGFRLLILDADARRRSSLSGRFANLGYQVTPVCHPRQALEAASFRHFDLAVLSSDWPGFDTSELIAKLRWQLGNVKFVVYLDSEAGNIPNDLSTHDVMFLRIDLGHSEELESTLEQLIDELLPEQRAAHSAPNWGLAAVP